jgi:hypothetical protein
MAADPAIDKLLEVRGFRISISGASETEDDVSWEDADGGQCVVETIECDEATHEHTPGKAYVSEIVMRGAMTDKRAALSQWLNDTTRSPDAPVALRTVRVTPMLRGNKDGATAVYLDCFPVGYAFPRLSVTNTTGNVQEEIRIKPVRCELK